MKISRSSYFYAVPAVAMMSLAALAGCSANDSDAGDQENTSSSAETSQAATDATSATASADSSQEVVEAKTPEGYQTVTAEANGISFAVPESWTELDPAAVAEDPQIKAEYEKLAQESGQDPEAFIQQAGRLDAWYMDLEAAQTEGAFASNINVEPEPISGVAEPGESDLKMLVENYGGETGEYSTAETSLGTAHLMNYTLNQGTSVYGMAVVVPTGEAHTYAILSVSADSAEHAKEYADAIVQSLTTA